MTPAPDQLVQEAQESARFDPRRQSPSVLYLGMSTSNVCNYRCKHCHIWQNEDRRDRLTGARRVALIGEFAAMSPGGTVVLQGGEVTLDLPQLMELGGACRAAGLPCLIVTNGSQIGDRETAQALAESGISIVSVSLDSHRPELHDFTRGVRGAFEQAVGAVRLLAETRARTGSPRVIVACVVFDRNAGELADYLEFCRGIGADHVDFQILARTFANRHPERDVFFERHFWHTREAKEQAIAEIRSFVLEHHDENGFLVKQPADLDWIASYIRDPDFRTTQPVCASHERNLIVDTEGNVALCFNTAAILSDPFVGNVRHATLRDLWAGAKAAQDRWVMDRCTLNCGALNCHRRASASS